MKRNIKILAVILIIIAILLVCNGIYCNNTVETINYNLTSNKLGTNLHFVVVSDQHNKEFGKNNIKLVKMIKNENPDFIAVCGDLVTRGCADDSVMKNFLTQISQIAPTYCILGNHEQDMLSQLDIKSDIKSTGAVLLDNDMVEFTKDGEIVLIGGLTVFSSTENHNAEENKFLETFSENSLENYSILLHHQPEYIGDIISDSNIDLVLCGHTHGGLVRIPFIGGLIAPNQGLFPKYDKGLFDFNGHKMIITSGLSNSHHFPRINNCAEMTVIDIN